MLPPERLTLGFARRFATYKRATLMFHNVPWLQAILTNPDRPVQVVFAGKAHPADRPGQDFIRHIVELSRSPELRGHIYIMENYDHRMARFLVQGSGRLGQQPPPARGGKRDLGDEGGDQRRHQRIGARRMVGRGLRRRQRLGVRLSESRTTTMAPRTTLTPSPSTDCSRTRSSPSSTNATSKACPSDGSS